MFTFTDALIMAAEAHRDKKDKGGDDYIKHPLYLYHKIRMNGGSNEAQITAILHDVIEDSHITVDNLRCSECPESIIKALELLTHKFDNKFYVEAIDNYKSLGYSTVDAEKKAIEDEYLRYVRRLSTNKLAKAIKIEDLIHNSDSKRLKNRIIIKEKDIIRIKKYNKALYILTGKDEINTGESVDYI